MSSGAPTRAVTTPVGTSAGGVTTRPATSAARTRIGPITAPDANGVVGTHPRVDLSAVADAPWFGLPALHAPSFELSAVVVVLPVVIALIAENAGHVKAVEEMTGTRLDSHMGRAIFADGFASTLSTAVGGPPTTTYAENIGVMAATRVYSTAAYWVAAVVAVLFGLCPKFGAVIAAKIGRAHV